MTELESKYNNYINLKKNIINEYIISYISNKKDDFNKDLIEAALYVVSQQNASRFRPLILLILSDILGSNSNNIDIACSLELLHNYSLVHDDMPCMDNDDYRRGVYSCHKKYNEYTALLLGNFLSNESYQLVLNSNICDSVKVIVLKEISYSLNSMLIGQYNDMKYSNNQFNISIALNKTIVNKIHINKTARLISSAFYLSGCLLNLDNNRIELLRDIGLSLGFVYQVKNDLKNFDLKNTSDYFNSKLTFPMLYSIDESYERINQTIDMCLKKIESIIYDKDKFIYLSNFIRNSIQVNKLKNY